MRPGTRPGGGGTNSALQGCMNCRRSSSALHAVGPRVARASLPGSSRAWVFSRRPSVIGCPAVWSSSSAAIASMLLRISCAVTSVGCWPSARASCALQQPASADLKALDPRGGDGLGAQQQARNRLGVGEAVHARIEPTHREFCIGDICGRRAVERISRPARGPAHTLVYWQRWRSCGKPLGHCGVQVSLISLGMYPRLAANLDYARPLVRSAKEARFGGLIEQLSDWNCCQSVGAPRRPRRTPRMPAPPAAPHRG